MDGGLNILVLLEQEPRLSDPRSGVSESRPVLATLACHALAGSRLIVHDTTSNAGEDLSRQKLNFGTSNLDDDKISFPAWQKARAPTMTKQKDLLPSQPTKVEPAVATGIAAWTSSQQGGGGTQSGERKELEVEDTKLQDEDHTIAQVKMFLDEPAVKHAPAGTKRSFLQSKGISPATINLFVPESNAAGFKSVIDATEFERFAKPTTQPTPHSELPPIVTYPEFLMQPQKPPPLVTPDRLLLTAYAAGAVGTLLYGLSRYVIAPLAQSLGETRHELFAHTMSSMETLNGRLSAVVSVQPGRVGLHQANNSAYDSESITSDPTELFHRDIGTQTSHNTSRRSSISSSSAEDPSSKSIKPIVERQEDHLRIISSQLQVLLANVASDQSTDVATQHSVSEFRDYLNSLLYLPPAQLENGVWHTAPKWDSKRDDGIATFKAEIRGVKGILLSARRFPGAGAMPIVRGPS